MFLLIGYYGLGVLVFCCVLRLFRPEVVFAGCLALAPLVWSLLMSVIFVLFGVFCVCCVLCVLGALITRVELVVGS